MIALVSDYACATCQDHGYVNWEETRAWADAVEDLENNNAGYTPMHLRFAPEQILCIDCPDPEPDPALHYSSRDHVRGICGVLAALAWACFTLLLSRRQ